MSSKYTADDSQRAFYFMQRLRLDRLAGEHEEEVAKLIASIRSEQRERDAEICDEYAARMEVEARKRPGAVVPESKADAGQTLAKLIRSGT